MGTRADIETAEAIKEQLEEVTLPELEAELYETLKTVEWLKQLIQEKRSEEFLKGSKLPGARPR